MKGTSYNLKYATKARFLSNPVVGESQYTINSSKYLILNPYIEVSNKHIGNVLSLFDGISCGQVALNRLGISYDRYYASEIDPYAMKVTSENYPHTVQLGSVTKVSPENLPKIDLLIGGSPCQGFSFAGKQLNFNDPRSCLFFEYVRLLKSLQPRYFLLENVVMKRQYQDIISEHLGGVEPVLINSSDFSAQNRPRLYWTNIPLLPIRSKQVFT